MLTMGRRRFRSQQRTAAPARQPPFRQEERTGGCRRGAGSKVPPRAARSRASRGGRPSAGEALESLPPVEDPWSPRAPPVSPLPHWRHPWSSAAINGGRGWRKARPLYGDMKQGPVPVKKAQCL